MEEVIWMEPHDGTGPLKEEETPQLLLPLPRKDTAKRQLSVSQKAGCLEDPNQPAP